MVDTYKEDLQNVEDVFGIVFAAGMNELPGKEEQSPSKAQQNA